jgi:hypothetical protein
LNVERKTLFKTVISCLVMRTEWNIEREEEIVFGWKIAWNLKYIKNMCTVNAICVTCLPPSYEHAKMRPHLILLVVRCSPVCSWVVLVVVVLCKPEYNFLGLPVTMTASMKLCMSQNRIYLSPKKHRYIRFHTKRVINENM